MSRQLWKLSLAALVLLLGGCAQAEAEHEDESGEMIGEFNIGPNPGD